MANEPDSFVEFLDDYFAECDEHLVAIRSGLLRLEPAVAAGAAAVDLDVAEDLFRRFHTIKGLSGMVGVPEAEELSHQMETVVRPLRQPDPTPLDRVALEALIDGARVLEQVITARRMQQPPPDVGPALARLAAALPASEARATLSAPEPPASAPSSGSLTAAESAHLQAALAQGGLAWRFEFVPSPDLAAHGINVNTVRDRLHELGMLIRSAPRIDARGVITFEFLLVSQADPETVRAICIDGLACWPYAEAGAPAGPAELSASARLTVAPPTGPGPGTSMSPAIVRVDLARLDDLMQLVGRLMVTHGRLEELLKQFDRLLPTAEWRDLQDANQALERELRDLREHVVRVRLVAIGELFERMRFVVRDLARKTRKTVVLDTAGQGTEIDKFIVEQMLDPLLHLVRNAIVHGIETPAERQAQGKLPEGRVGLRASTFGDQVVIEVEDDGRGIDVARVTDRARQLGLLDPGEELRYDHLLSILAAPGLTTRVEADLTSGRGVGMAVVRNQVQALGGSLSVATQAGAGTCFTIQLPLTLLIAEALIVAAAGQVYAVPQATVHELVEVPAGAATAVDGHGPHGEIITYRGRPIPLIHLASAMGLVADLPGAAGGPGTGYALVVGPQAAPTGLLVDRLLGQREIVVQPLADPLLHVTGVTGAAELGGGHVVLILDPGAIVGRQTATLTRPLASHPPAEPGHKAGRQPDRAGDQGDATVSGSQPMAEPYILFRLADTTYAVRSSAVQHVEMVGSIAPIPDAPPFLDGVALARGQMIPAVNLRTRFGFDRVPYDLRTRLIVVHAAGRTVGLVVDSAREFVTIPTDAIQPPPESMADLSGNFVEGIASLADRLVVILNIDEVLSLADALPPSDESLSQGGEA